MLCEIRALNLILNNWFGSSLVKLHSNKIKRLILLLHMLCYVVYTLTYALTTIFKQFSFTIQVVYMSSYHVLFDIKDTEWSNEIFSSSETNIRSVTQIFSFICWIVHFWTFLRYRHLRYNKIYINKVEVQRMNSFP